MTNHQGTHTLVPIWKQDRTWILITFILLVPATFWNLGLLPLLADEPTRGLISAEMIFSGDFIVPTMNGWLYFNKPPLYNWILIGFFELFGNFSELTLRLPSVIPMWGFAFHIYLYFKQKKDWKVGALVSLIWLTNGRLLIYSSLLGHIDILYSWLVFAQFTLMEKFSREQKWSSFYLWSYLFCLVGFMMKGLPSLPFQALTTLALIYDSKQWKKLFHWAHFMGISILIGGTTLYFWMYEKAAPGNLIYWAEVLFSESSKRTAMEKSVWQTIGHLIGFPFDQIYHLLPWSLLIFFLLRKDFWKKVKEDDVLRRWGLIFLFNIPIYWLSPDVLPRYLFMLYPVVFLFLAEGYLQNNRDSDPTYFRWIAGFLALLIVLSPIAFHYIPSEWIIPGIPWKGVFLFLAGILCLIALWRWSVRPIWIVALTLALFRLGFDWIVLPARRAEMAERHFKESAVEVARLTQGQPLTQFFPVPGSPEEPEGYRHRMGPEPIYNDDILYYITTERKAVLPINLRIEDLEENHFYLIYTQQLDTISLPPHNEHYRFNMEWMNKEIQLVTFNLSEK